MLNNGQSEPGRHTPSGQLTTLYEQYLIYVPKRLLAERVTLALVSRRLQEDIPSSGGGGSGQAPHPRAERDGAGEDRGTLALPATLLGAWSPLCILCKMCQNFPVLFLFSILSNFSMARKQTPNNFSSLKMVNICFIFPSELLAIFHEIGRAHV